MSLARRNNFRLIRNGRPMGYGVGMALARSAWNNRNRLVSGVRSAMFTRNRTQTGSKRMSAGQGVTSQYDRRLIYRKRTMPRYKKRSWRRFKNKVLAVSTKSLGSNTIVRNHLTQSEIGLTPANSQSQNIVQCALYPVRSVNDDMNDVNEIMSDSRFNNSSKAIFCSGVLDITMRFQSLLFNVTPPGPTGNPNLGAEVDVYEMSWNGPSGQAGEAGDLINAFQLAATDTATIPSHTNALTPFSRGWTPFDSNAALSQHKIKIWKKTKFFLSAEQTATYQVRDPRTHYFSKDAIPSATSANWQGVTKWVFIVWKVLPGYNYVAAPNNDVARLNVGFTRKYMYKINQDSTDYDCFNT